MKFIPFSEFSYWFVITRPTQYSVFNRDGKYVGIYSCSSDSFYLKNDNYNAKDIADVVSMNFNRFAFGRPEYLVGLPFSEREDKSGYVDRLCGAKAIQEYATHKTNPDETIALYRKQLEWLDGTDFFTAPASTRYHNCIEGGLFSHTKEVYNCALNLLNCDNFSGVSIPALTIAALIHDWCKIDLYEKYEANVFDENLQQWVKQTKYRHKDSGHPFGHGETSMYLGARVLNIREEEALAVRWHMGKWYTPDAYNNDLEYANRVVPLVLLIQFADALSITDY